MDFNTALDYLEEGDLNKCGFSLRSLSSISFSKGMAVFSISSILSVERPLTGRFLSSKERTGFSFFLTEFPSYLFFFWALAASFIFRMASSRDNVFDFFRSSRITFLGSLPWSNGLDGSWVTEDFITHKDAKNSGVKLIRHNSIRQFGLHLRPVPAKSVSYPHLSGKQLIGYVFYYYSHIECSKIILLDNLQFPSIALSDCDEQSGSRKAILHPGHQRDAKGIYQFRIPYIFNKPAGLPSGKIQELVRLKYPNHLQAYHFKSIDFLDYAANTEKVAMKVKLPAIFLDIPYKNLPKVHERKLFIRFPILLCLPGLLKNVESFFTRNMAAFLNSSHILSGSPAAKGFTKSGGSLNSGIVSPDYLLGSEDFLLEFTRWISWKNSSLGILRACFMRSWRSFSWSAT